MTSMEPTPPSTDDLPAFLRIAQEHAGDVRPEDLPPEPTPEERAREVSASLAEDRRLRALAAWRETCPAMYRDARLGDLMADRDQSAAAHAASQWLLTRGALTLVIAGPIGTGKTHLAAATAHAATEMAVRPFFVTVGDLMDALRPEGSKALARAATQARLLVLDDLGATRPTEFAVESMTSLMDTRLREERRTIITTNADAATLQEAWGARLVDRMSHRMVPVVLAGASRRRPW